MFSSFDTVFNLFSKNIDEIISFIDFFEKYRKYEEERYSIKSKCLLYKNIHKIILPSLQYSTVIVRLYGAYENYVDNIIDHYLKNIKKLFKPENINSCIRENNIIAVADFLKNEKQYKHLNIDKKDVLSDIYDGKISNKIFLKHSGNLKINALNELFRRIGITGIISRIPKERVFVNYYASNKSMNKKSAKNIINKQVGKDIKKGGNNILLYEKLETLVNERNIISHSTQDSRDQLSLEMIKNEYIPFLKAICESIKYVIIKQHFELCKNNHLLEEIDNVIVYSSSTFGFKDKDYCIENKSNVFYVEKDNKCFVVYVEDTKKHTEGRTFKINLNFSKLKKVDEKKYKFYCIKLKDK